MDPQTTGLWIWVRPHPRNPDLNVILMDTEGLDSPHIPQWYNWTLAAVALLISSYFIYQTKGSIDANAIDRLGVILKVGEQLRGGQDSSTDKPNFLWLIRDQQLQMKKAPRQEMYEKLDPGAQIALEKCFSDYECILLPRPVDRDELLKEVDNMTWDQLRSDFREEYVVLERQIFNSVSNERKLSGRTITGDVIASLLSKYAGAIAAKDSIMTSLSQLPTQRQMIVKMAGERAVKEASSVYQSQMEPVTKTFPVPESVLSSAHKEAYDSAVVAFKREALTDETAEIDSELQVYLTELNNIIAKWEDTPSIIDGACVQVKKLVGGLFEALWNENIATSKSRSKKELETLYAPIREKISQSQYDSTSAFQDDVKALQTNYVESTNSLGISKNQTLRDFLKEISKDVEAVNNSLLRKEIARLQLDANDRITKLTEQLNVQHEQLKSQYSAQNGEFTKKFAESDTALKNITSEFQQSVGQLTQQISEQERRQTDKVAAVQEAISKLEVPVAVQTEKINAISPKVDALSEQIQALPLLSAKLSNLEKSNEAQFSQQEKMFQSLEAKLNQFVQAEITSLKDWVTKENQAATTSAMNQVRDCENKLGTLQTTLTGLNERVNSFGDQFGSLLDALKSQFETANTKWENQFVASSKELSSLQEKLISLGSQLDEERSKQQQQSTDLQELRQLLQSHATDLRSISSQQEQASVQFSSRFVELEKTTENRLAAEIAVLNNDLKNLSSMRETQDQLATSVSDARESLSEVMQKIAVNEQSFGEREAGLLRKIEQSGEEAAALRRSLNEIDKSNKQHIAELLEGSRRTGEELTALKNHISGDEQTLQSSLADMAAQFEELKSQNARDIAKVEQHLQHATNTNDVKVLLETFRVDQNQVEASVSSLGHQLNQRIDKIIQDLGVSKDTTSRIISDHEVEFARGLLELKTNNQQAIQQLQEVAQSSSLRANQQSDHLRNLETGLSVLSTKLDQRITAIQNHVQTTADGLSKGAEDRKALENIRHALDSIWSSIGVLSGRIVDMEAHMDLHR
eukprot:TRINITY_DN3481_c0_g1_i2.p1 TRINITY_DN3481_c0_g1~~TRINITY_DN3481_c0_g1_i2.p1  ORF type:complete len:1119 (-),score=263.77 TRINITY_DN3481_c0_g1_i2:20-3124(-)